MTHQNPSPRLRAGQAAARATLYFLIVLAVVWAFVAATRQLR
mgnify:CR=1 FL=1